MPPRLKTPGPTMPAGTTEWCGRHACVALRWKEQWDLGRVGRVYQAGRRRGAKNWPSVRYNVDRRRLFPVRAATAAGVSCTRPLAFLQLGQPGFQDSNL